jgi:PhzF family phenazine biosynthesis protein
MTKIPYYHVDVFSNRPLSGNGLTVFPQAENFSTVFMQRLTQEMRQFESIFLQKIDERKYSARVFTCEEELDFAGHPLLGAAAVLLEINKKKLPAATFEFKLNKKTVTVTTNRNNNIHEALMNQGKAEFGKVLTQNEAADILAAMNLSVGDLYPDLMPMVVSTGLPYLLLPLQKNALEARIKIPDMVARMQPFGAKFIGTLDIPDLSIRTWDNFGIVEDAATGSLAGPSGAYLVKLGFKRPNEVFELKQGYNIGRPSQLFVEVRKDAEGLGDVFVGGNVCKVANGFVDPDLIYLQ